MKTKQIPLILIAALGITTASVLAQQAALAKVDLIQKLPGQSVHKIEDGEITLNGDFIKRIEVGKNTAIITYLNKREENKQPKYDFRVFNAYGLEIGRFADKWVIDFLKPGDTRKENAAFLTHQLNSFFEYSDVKLPSDWDRPEYILIIDQGK